MFPRTFLRRRKFVKFSKKVANNIFCLCWNLSFWTTEEILFPHKTNTALSTEKAQEVSTWLNWPPLLPKFMYSILKTRAQLKLFIKLIYTFTLLLLLNWFLKPLPENLALFILNWQFFLSVSFTIPSSRYILFSS